MKPYLVAIVATLASVFAPVQSILIVTFIMILADLATGIYAAKKRGEQIQSSAIRRTVSKIFVYEIAIALGFLAQHYLMGDVIPVSNMIASVVGMVELKSVLENLNSLSGQDLLKTVIDKLGSKNKEIEDEGVINASARADKKEKDSKTT